MEADPDDHVTARYNDSNRAFLQALMARGTLTLKEAKPILAAIFSAQDGGQAVRPEDVSDADFQTYLSAASTALSPFDYEIRSTLHQVTKERIYALVNSTSDPITQLATSRTPDELSYIKRVLDAMFETYNTARAEIMGVTSLQALKVARPPAGRQSVGGGEEGGVDKGLTSSQAEKLLGSMVEEGWFERSKEGWYTLSARALLELKNYLVATYNEEGEEEEWQRIKNCEACKNIVTVGQRCGNLDCIVRLHDTCQAAFWRTRQDGKCPRCRRDWEGHGWVGEKAVTETEAYNKARRISGSSRRRRTDEVAENEVEAEEEN